MGRRNSNGCKSDNNNLSNTRYLTRIITFLSEIQEKATISELKVNIGAASLPRIKDAVNWLICNGILLRKRENSNKVCYKINPIWEKVVTKK